MGSQPGLVDDWFGKNSSFAQVRPSQVSVESGCGHLAVFLLQLQEWWLQPDSSAEEWYFQGQLQAYCCVSFHSYQQETCFPPPPPPPPSSSSLLFHTLTLTCTARIFRSSPQFGVTLLTYEMLQRLFYVDFGKR